MFSLSHVAAFIEVIETGSFHEASRRLQISQPTVSHNVKRLEDILGVRLVERRKDKCVPTRQGLVFLPFARSLLTVNGGVKSCHAAAQKSATCGARMRPPGGLRPERGSHVRVAIFEGRQPAFRARLWARR